MLKCPHIIPEFVSCVTLMSNYTLFFQWVQEEGVLSHPPCFYIISKAITQTQQSIFAKVSYVQSLWYVGLFLLPLRRETLLSYSFLWVRQTCMHVFHRSFQIPTIKFLNVPLSPLSHLGWLSADTLIQVERVFYPVEGSFWRQRIMNNLFGQTLYNGCVHFALCPGTAQEGAGVDVCKPVYKKHFMPWKPVLPASLMIQQSQASLFPTWCVSMSSGCWEAGCDAERMSSVSNLFFPPGSSFHTSGPKVPASGDH